MCKAEDGRRQEALVQTTSFDMEFTLEIHFEVPSVDFNEKLMLEWIKLNMFKWCRGLKIDRSKLAEVMGLHNRDWVSIGSFNLDANNDRCFAVKYDAAGRRHTDERA